MPTIAAPAKADLTGASLHYMTAYGYFSCSIVYPMIMFEIRTAVPKAK